MQAFVRPLTNNFVILAIVKGWNNVWMNAMLCQI